jgi:lambda family phage portal protein
VRAADADGRWWERAADAVVGLFSPSAAAVRVHWRRVSRDEDYRRAYETALRLRGYTAASTNPNDTPWLNTSDRSADGELLGSGALRELRRRARAAGRDDAIAAGLYGTLRRGVIGTGLRPQARSKPRFAGEDPAVTDLRDEAMEGVWRERADRLYPGDGNLTQGDHQALLYTKVLEDGGVWLRPAVTRPGEPVWFETIEADRVQTPHDARPVHPGGRIVEGVEKDDKGRVVAYWVLRVHPGDTGLPGTTLGPKAVNGGLSAFSVRDFDRVPADVCKHVRSRVTRPGQTHGVPLMHAVLQDLKDLDLLILACLKRSQIAACLTVFLTSEEAAPDLLDLTAADYGYQLKTKLEPGRMFRLFPGEEAKFLDPKNNAPDLAAFVLLLAKRIGAAVGLSPQAVLRDWGSISYSGARTIKIDDRQTFRAERSSFAHQALDFQWQVVMADALLRGDPRLVRAGVLWEDVLSVEWIGDEAEWVDPQAEAAATQLMLGLGLTTIQVECARLGRDWQDMLRQRAAAEAFDRDLREELDLPPAALPGAPAPAAPEEEPASEPETPDPRTTTEEAETATEDSKKAWGRHVRLRTRPRPSRRKIA